MGPYRDVDNSETISPEEFVYVEIASKFWSNLHLDVFGCFGCSGSFIIGNRSKKSVKKHKTAAVYVFKKTRNIRKLKHHWYHQNQMSLKYIYLHLLPEHDLEHNQDRILGLEWCN